MQFETPAGERGSLAEQACAVVMDKLAGDDGHKAVVTQGSLDDPVTEADGADAPELAAFVDIESDGGAFAVGACREFFGEEDAVEASSLVEVDDGVLPHDTGAAFARSPVQGLESEHVVEVEARGEPVVPSVFARPCASLPSASLLRAVPCPPPYGQDCPRCRR